MSGQREVGGTTCSALPREDAGTFPSSCFWLWIDTFVKWPESFLAIYQWYELSLFLGAINRKPRCGMTGFWHCDQIFVNNLMERGFQSVQSFMLVPLILGLWWGRALQQWKYVAKLLTSLQIGSRQEACRKRSWQDKAPKHMSQWLSPSNNVPLLFFMTPLLMPFFWVHQNTNSLIRPESSAFGSLCKHSPRHTYRQ